MKLFLGIDGGGTHTTACIIDYTGRIISRATGGVGNPNHVTDADLQANFFGLAQELLHQAGTSADDIVSVFAGVAGVTSVESAARVRQVLIESGLDAAHIGVDHDIRIALAGGLAGRPGMALIVGTGSSCYGRDANGQTWQTGGWGALISDEGSGYFLGREAMTAAVRMTDGRQPETDLRKAVFDWLGITSISDIMDRIYVKELSRPDIAAFAPTVLQLAAEDDPAALGILASGAQELAEMVVANHACLPTSTEPEVVITGGLGTANTCYRPLIETAIKRRLPAVKITESELSPTAGAAMLAIEQYSGRVPSEIVSNLKGSS